jgi:hypothetical protein
MSGNFVLVLGRTAAGADQFLRPRKIHNAFAGMFSAASLLITDTLPRSGGKGHRHLPTGKYMVPEVDLFGVDTLAGLIFDRRYPEGSYQENLGLCDFCEGALVRQEEWVEKTVPVFLAVHVTKDSIRVTIHEDDPGFPEGPWLQETTVRQALEQELAAVPKSSFSPKLFRNIGLVVGLIAVLCGAIFYVLTSNRIIEEPKGAPAAFFRTIQDDNTFAALTLGTLKETLQSTPGVFLAAARLQKRSYGFELVVTFADTPTVTQRHDVMDAIGLALQQQSPLLMEQYSVAPENSKLAALRCRLNYRYPILASEPAPDEFDPKIAGEQQIKDAFQDAMGAPR